MAGPRDFIKRAAKTRQTDGLNPQVRMPAPIPMQGAYPGMNALQPPAQAGKCPAPPNHSEMPAAEADRRENASMQPVARNVGGHALYRELMRSHDRMGTRHIGR